VKTSVYALVGPNGNSVRVFAHSDPRWHHVHIDISPLISNGEEMLTKRACRLRSLWPAWIMWFSKFIGWTHLIDRLSNYTHFLLRFLLLDIKINFCVEIGSNSRWGFLNPSYIYKKGLCHDFMFSQQFWLSVGCWNTIIPKHSLAVRFRDAYFKSDEQKKVEPINTYKQINLNSEFATIINI